MLPLQELWVFEIVIIAATALLMAVAVNRIRLESRLRWPAIAMGGLSYLICVSMAVGHLFMSQSLEDNAKVMRARTGSAVLPENWGTNFTKEKRTEYSEAMARYAYTNWGEIAVYIDLQGVRRPYTPTQTDQQNRKLHLAYLNNLDQAQVTFLSFGLAWLMVPILGMLIGFLSWAQPLLRVLTTRSKADRAPAAPSTLS